MDVTNEVRKTKLPLGRTFLVAVLLAPAWIALGNFLLLRFVHSEGPLLWIAQILLLPDLLFSLVASPEGRAGLWFAVLAGEFLYVWAVVCLVWWGLQWRRPVVRGS